MSAMTKTIFMPDNLSETWETRLAWVAKVSNMSWAILYLLFNGPEKANMTLPPGAQIQSKQEKNPETLEVLYKNW